MTGLEKIKERIIAEAKNTAADRMREAEAAAGGILDQARAEAEKKVSAISRRSRTEVANYEERIRSSNDLARRTKLLETRQEVIADVVKKARESLSSLSSEKYFDLLKRLAVKNVQPKEGEMYLSAADLARLPEGFDREMAKIAEDAGGSLRISGEARDIRDGFVLVYGGIEENCTLDAIFGAMKDELSDIVRGILFR